MPNTKISVFIVSSTLLLATFSLTSSEVFAEPLVRIKKNFYFIEGSTARKLRKSLNRNSPVKIGRTNYDAYTSWDITWRYDYIKKNTGCVIYNVRTKVEVNQTLPRVISQLPKKLSRKWQSYYSALLKHENKHKKLGILAGQEIEKQLNSMPPQTDCKTLENMANSLSQEIIDKYIKIEQEYDKKTNHGAAEGARFP